MKTAIFKSKLDQNVLESPKEALFLKKTLQQIKNAKNQPKTTDKNTLKLFEQMSCVMYRNITDVTPVKVGDICRQLKENNEFIAEKIKKTEKKIILLIGELHSSQESFLTEISLLAYLKKQKLSASLMIEFDKWSTISYKTQSLYDFLDIDARHFAYHVHKFDLVGIDDYHAQNENDLMPANSIREKGMKKPILDYMESSPYKINPVTIGYSHLPALQIISNKNDFELIAINTAKVHSLERILTGMSLEENENRVKARYEALDKIKPFTFSHNLESMSFEQILDIYQICDSQAKNMQEIIYIPAALKECNFISDSDFVGCSSSTNIEL